MHSGRIRSRQKDAAHFLLGIVAVALMGIFCYRLHLGAATAGLLYLGIVMLQALAGGFIAAALIASIAAAFLTYFFLAPIHAFRGHNLVDLFFFLTFLATSLLVAWLLSNVRKTLQQEQRHLALAQNAAGLGIWDCHLRSGKTAFSADYAKLYGLAADHRPLTHEEWLGLVHPDDRERIQTLVEDSLVRTHVWDTEFRVVWPDGSVHWLLGKGAVFLDRSGHPVRMAGVNLDITGGKQTEAALRESEQRYREVFDITSDCIFLIDITSDCRFKFERLNSASEKTMGFTTADVSGRYVEEILGEKIAEEVTANYRRCLEAGTLIDYEEELHFRGGDGYFHTNLIPVRDAEGRIHRIVGVSREITERKRAEAALKDSEERFRKVFEDGPLGIALVGSDNRFLKTNSALCRMVGYSEAELTQLSWLDITPAEDVPADLVQTERLFREEISSYRLTKRYVKKCGEIIWINLTASIIRDLNGTPVYGVGMMEDITEIKRAQEEAFARQKLESVGALAGGIAHDFNNLLGSILGQAQLAQMDLPADSSTYEALERIAAVATNAARIVRELMIYSGQDQATLEPVDVSELVEEMLGLLKVSIPKHVVLKTNLEKNIPAVQANSTQLRQVVLNLVINASEAIPETGGIVSVATGRMDASVESALLGSINVLQGECLRLEVSDTGCGITEQSKAKIFDPFFSTKFAGRGLGLAVVQSIVRAHGGAINLVSAPGEGTTFQILFPCSAEPAKRHESITTPVLEGRVAGTVLLVEDEDSLRLAVSMMLRKKGFSVIEAADGCAALDRFCDQTRNIDVILLDMTMPGISSREIIAEARRIRPDIKILLMSAYSREMVMPNLDPSQISGFVRKPFHLRELVQLIEDTVSCNVLCAHEEA